jgi:hypothetical protein
MTYEEFVAWAREHPGERVRMPFRGRRIVGTVMGIQTHPTLGEQARVRFPGGARGPHWKTIYPHDLESVEVMGDNGRYTPLAEKTA